MINFSSFRFTNWFVALILAVSSCALAAADSDEAIPRIVVTGEGKVQLAPDMALLTLTVTREAETARAALDANSSAMGDVLEAMQAQGIARRDLQTSNFAIKPKYTYPPAKPSGQRPAPRIVGYTVRNSLSVRVRDLAKLGVIIDQSVSLGVNEGGGIVFSNDDPSVAIALARGDAMRACMAKARTLADAAGVKVGRVLDISEQSYQPRPMPMARREMAMAAAADAVPIATGDNTYKVTVTASFAINQ